MSDLHRHAVAATTIFDGTEAHVDSAVLIEGSQIAWLGPAKHLPANVPVHTLPDGAWLAPGFIDVQVNGGGDVLFNDEPTADGIARIAAAHRRFGTTTILPTLISDTTEKMRAALEAFRECVSPGIAGVHLEGPFLSPLRPGVHDPAMIRCPTKDDLELLTSGKAGMMLITLAPEQVPAGFIGALVRAGVRVAFGHSMATYAQTKAALVEGMTGFTHLFNAMRPMESREPGPIAAALESPQVHFSMIVDGVHVHSAMLGMALRGAARPMLVTDAMPPVGGNSTTFSLHGRRVHVHNAACMTDNGTLAGTALDMASAVRNCVRLLDVPLSTALRYASVEPAQFLGLGNFLGRLARGYRADMLALDPQNVHVIQTWVEGTIGGCGANELRKDGV